MAKVWACYDNDASKPWGELPIPECEERLNLSPADYLCSGEQFGPHGKLQTEPDHTHVVIEVSENEAATARPGSPASIDCGCLQRRFTENSASLNGAPYARLGAARAPRAAACPIKTHQNPGSNVIETRTMSAAS
jgi:hypothetical protein